MSNRLETHTANSRYLSGINLPESGFGLPQRLSESSEITDLGVAMAASLRTPVDYPPISESMFVGDQIAIVLQADLPKPREILQALIPQLNGMDFVVVCSPETSQQIESFGEVNGKLIVHDPTDENALGMIGIDDKSAPVYVNRMLSEADVVIPIGAAAGPNEPISDCVYPYFSGLADREQFENRSPKSRGGQIRLANNQLGTFWGIQLVFGPGDTIHQIITGELGAAKHLAQQTMAELWQVNVPDDADLVVTTIESETSHQSWDQFCAAIISADQIAKAGAPVLVCSELGKMPPTKIKAALTQEFETQSKIKLNATLRKLAAIAVERTLFLQSELTQAQTEELGLGCVSSPEELQRIIDQHPNGVLLRDAHRCNLTNQ